jgi:hypothetical protein
MPGANGQDGRPFRWRWVERNRIAPSTRRSLVDGTLAQLVRQGWLESDNDRVRPTEQFPRDLAVTFVALERR